LRAAAAWAHLLVEMTPSASAASPQPPRTAHAAWLELMKPGQPLFSAPQHAHQVAGDLDLGQILDLVVAIAKIPGTPEYRQPILDAALAGLHTRGT
jgi:hypothetical protein